MSGELRRSLGVARGAIATLGTGMKFLDDSAQARIGFPSIVRAGVVHNLVAVTANHPRPFEISPEISVRAPGAVSLPSK
jgi:hypothetical protein